MAGFSDTTFFDSFTTLTLRNYQKTQEKQFFEYRPGVKVLFEDFANTDSRGGRLWQGIAEYGFNPSIKFFDGAETFSQEVAQTNLPIVYQWRYMGGTVSLTKTETLENSGPVALGDILEARVRQLNRSFNLIIGNEIFSDGTNYGGKTFTGLAAAISTSPTTGTVGGLDSASYSWWRNVAQTGCGTFATNGVNGSSSDLMLRTYNNCTDGMIERPNVIISDQRTYESYIKTLYTPVRFVDQVRGKADLSFQGVEYQGIPWYWDRQCPTGRIYFLNTKHIHFIVDPRYKFEWTADMSYPNQLAYTRICGLRFFLATKSRMFLGVADGWTA